MRTSRGTAAIRQAATRRAAIVVALVATVAATGAITTGTARAQTPEPPTPTAPSAIAVSFTPGPSSPGCTAFPFEVTHAAGSTPQEFRIRITLARRLCTPVGATAVVYAMPSYATAWPQTLAERTSLTLQEPGTYVVGFTKGCSPQQFDLLAGTGASITPQVVSPTGPWHGPLLFPVDLSTSLQWRGCGPDPVIPEFPAPALALGFGALAAGGAVWWRRRSATGSPA